MEFQKDLINDSHRRSFTWGDELWRLLNALQNDQDKPKLIEAVLNFYFKGIEPELDGPELAYAFRVARSIISEQEKAAQSDPSEN